MLKQAQRALTEGRASRLCYTASSPEVTVTVGELLIAHVSGVHRCGSLWNCPLCAPVVRQGRAKEIDLAASRVLNSGGCGLFVTATGPHRMGDPLAPLFDLTCQFGKLTMNGAKARELRTRLGLIGSIRTIDVTYTENGWHPHVHQLMLFVRQLSPGEVAELRTFLFGRWQGALTRRGFAKLHPVHGLDVRPVTDAAGLSEYLAKVEGDDGWGIGWELARSDLKHRSVSPMQLLADWALGRDLVARALWKEYEAVTYGRRCIQWTPGLRAALVPDVEEVDDEELAAREGEDEALVTVTFGHVEWNGWVKRGEVAVVLRQVEEAAALLMFLARFGSSTREVAA